MLADVTPAKKHSYGQILKSTALIGGSSAVNIVIGIVRTKAMAMLLGPAGFGLMGVYGAIIDVAQSIAGMGINSSGVRQIASAVEPKSPATMGRRRERMIIRSAPCLTASRVMAEVGSPSIMSGSQLSADESGIRVCLLTEFSIKLSIRLRCAGSARSVRSAQWHISSFAL